MRFLASIIDGFIVGGLQAAAALALVGELEGAQVVGLVIGFAYTVGFWATQGATPGKMAVGCKIISVEGDELSPGRAIGRYFAMFLSALTLGIGFLMIAFTEDKRGLHDYVAGTVVIKTR
jgi:uncharacterized RDD family membrane protein YckC